MTLSEIAKQAGVSITTVHRVFSGKEDVHPDTADKIKSIAKLGGYVPKEPKKSNYNSDDTIRNSITGNIGLFLSGLPKEYLQLPQNIEVFKLLESALKRYKLKLIVVQEDKDNNVLDLIHQNELEGLIIVGDIPKPTRESVKKFPCVGIFGSNYYELPKIDWVLPDYQSRAHLVVDYLISKGHERLMFFNPTINHAAFEEVGIEMYRYGKKLGIDIHLFDVSILEGASDLSTLQRIEKLVERYLHIPVDSRATGVFTANDEVALDFYYQMGLKGIALGEDIEVVSSDNTEVFLKHMSPRPVSVDLNYPQLVDVTVDRLIRRIEDPLTKSGVRILVQPKIINQKM